MLREECFSKKKKVFTNELNIGLPLWAYIEKTFHVVETHRLSSKEKVVGAAVTKEGDADSLLGH